MLRLRKVILLLCLSILLTGCRKEAVVTLDQQEENQAEDKETNETESKETEPKETEKTQNNEIDNGTIAVFVCGAVTKSGVYSLKANSRVYEAIEAAGGFAEPADCNYLNQAETLQDGQKIYVPTKEEVQAGMTDPSGGSGALAKDTESAVQGSSKEQSKVNINTATKEELMGINGIGEAKATSIINYRNTNGGFQKIEEIMEIEGIKEGTFNKLKDQITVGS